MRLPTILIGLISLLLGNLSLARDPQWFQQRMNDLEKAIREPDDHKKFPKLGEFMGLARFGYKSMDSEQKEIFDKAQSALLAIPGHAKYYQNQIEQTRTFLKHYKSLPKEERFRMEQEYRDRNEDLFDHTNYEGVREKAFVILGQLPSPETVAVLGHFLEDPEGRDGKDLLGNPIHIGSDMGPPAPNCGKAYFALGKLGIEHPPVPPSTDEDVVLNVERADAWKQWWSEVKSGKRTYRFIGSPIDYGPDGPATKEQLERIAKNQRREDRTSGNRGSAPADSEERGLSVPAKPSTTYVVIGVVATLLASFAWYFRKTKSAT